MKPFWITFYSYKGGVGRSLALANIAALMVKNGRRVVLIDFDLEAPGLDSFDEFASVVGKKGVVEYTTEFLQTEKAPEIEHFVHHCHLRDAPAGDLWIMPAGRKDASYNRERGSIDWAEMYDNGVGLPFVENWKAAIANHFKPDYVLVDSRTGLTDVGGICTLHLPDLVVMLFGLNDQNIKGIAAVARTVLQSNGSHIPQLYYVASPVPNMSADKKDLVSERLIVAKKEIGVAVESIIRYSSSAALHESLFALHDRVPLSPLVEDYQNLLDKLIVFNRNGIDLITKEVESAISASDVNRIQKLESVLASHFSERAEGCYLLSRVLLALNDRHKAVAAAIRAISIDPAHFKSFNYLLTHYRAECQTAEALALCDTVLNAKTRLTNIQLLTICSEKGTVAMNAGKYQVAAQAYSKAIEIQGRGNLSCWDLVLYFNLAEADRRASRVINPELWKRVVELFEHSGSIADFSPPMRVNCLQAMHIAFAVTGDLTRARQTLDKARDAANLLGTVDEVFSVKNYLPQPVSLFLTENDEMISALERGELWDGMKLPVSTSIKHDSTKE